MSPPLVKFKTFQLICLTAKQSLNTCQKANDKEQMANEKQANVFGQNNRVGHAASQPVLTNKSL